MDKKKNWVNYENNFKNFEILTVKIILKTSNQISKRKKESWQMSDYNDNYEVLFNVNDTPDLFTDVHTFSKTKDVQVSLI